MASDSNYSAAIGLDDFYAALEPATLHEVLPADDLVAVNTVWNEGGEILFEDAIDGRLETDAFTWDDEGLDLVEASITLPPEDLGQQKAEDVPSEDG